MLDPFFYLGTGSQILPARPWRGAFLKEAVASDNAAWRLFADERVGLADEQAVGRAPTRRLADSFVSNTTRSRTAVSRRAPRRADVRRTRWGAASAESSGIEADDQCVLAVSQSLFEGKHAVEGGDGAHMVTCTSHQGE
jgi:hypothetical protein